MDNVFEQVLFKKSDDLHSQIQSLIEELGNLIHDNELYSLAKTARSKAIFSSLQLAINEFESSPKLLDLKLSIYIESLADSYLFLYSIKSDNDIKRLKRGIAGLIYEFSKIRGFKFITNFFSSDVYLIPKLLELTETTDLSENETFLILIWLSNLVLVPFPLTLIREDLPTLLLDFALSCLEKHSNASKNQSVALILISRLISRQDLIQDGMLDVYFNDTVPSIWNSSSYNSGSIKLGHSMVINKLMKRCSFEVMYKYLVIIHKEVILIDLINIRTQEESCTNELNNLNVLYIIKILNKLAKFYLQLPETGKYCQVSSIVNNLFHDVMSIMLDRFDTNLRYAMAKNLSSICSQLTHKAMNYQEQLIQYLIEQLEIPNTIITYSPYEKSTCNSNRFHADLAITSDTISIPKYHTVLLFFAYVSLKKSLPYHLILPILSIVHKTLFIQQKRATSFLGSQLRDSSCFIIWSLCRMIKPDTFIKLQRENNNMMEFILFDLIKVAIFDFDLTIRRCSVAVIQEFLGRYGNNLFGSKFVEDATFGEQMGLFIIRLVEVFHNKSLGSLNLSYLMIHELIRIGFEPNLFVPCLLKNIQDDNISFQVKKLNAHHLAKIYKDDLSKEFEFEFLGKFQDLYTLQTLLLSLTREILNTGDSLYAFSELAVISPDASYQFTLEIANHLKENFKFDHHCDPNEKAEGYIKWINCCVMINFPIIDFGMVWKEIFNIVKTKYTTSLAEEFKQFFRLLRKRNVILTSDHLKGLGHLIKSNNLIIAQSLFYYQNFSINNKLFLIDLIQEKAIDCNTRSSMIECLSENLENLNLNFSMLSVLVNMLDDYTITNQGDVGSKVRLSAMYLIKNNISIFVRHTDDIELKLMRISGELIDKLRFESIKLIHILRMKDFVEIDNSNNYKFLFEYYRNEILTNKKQSNHIIELSISFWRGIVFSLGALTMTSSITNEAFIQVLVFLESLNHENHDFVFKEFLKLLKVPTDRPLNTLNSRELKTYTMTLNVFVKLFESNTPFPIGFNFQVLYVRCYNLHINTSNVLRIGIILKIFQYLGTLQCQPDIRLKAQTRVCWLCCHHPLLQVRSIGSEVFFEILNDISPHNDCISILDSVNWEESPRKLKKYFHCFQQTLTTL